MPAEADRVATRPLEARHRAPARRDRGAAPVPGRRRAGVPGAGPGLGHALRRRAPAGAAGGAARLGAGGDLLHPGRADGRAASARHRPADRQPATAPGDGQQRRGRRARRVADPRGRLGRRPRARGRPGRRHRSWPPRRRTGCRPPPARSRRQYLDRKPAPLEKDDARGRLARSPGWIEIRGAAVHNLKHVDARIPLAALTGVTGRQRVGEELAGARRAGPIRAPGPPSRRRPARGRVRSRRAPGRSTGSSRLTRARSAARPGRRPRRPRGCSTRSAGSSP